MTLNLFYEEPDPDRWIPFDRYPRGLIRRIIRGLPKPGGQKRVFLNLLDGLDKLNIAYRINDYKYLRKNPDELACVIGKPCVLEKLPGKNPILFGSSIFSHPLDDPDLLHRLPVKRILVPGDWMKKMFEPYFPNIVYAWPVGIDTEKWRPSSHTRKEFDCLVYDKIRWNREQEVPRLLDPVIELLQSRNLSTKIIKYGNYQEDEFESLLRQAIFMVYICEHETQGIAYQQALSANVPIMAWDRQGYWLDPSYYPERVKFSPVTAVPYWSQDCGECFQNADDFPGKLKIFLDKLHAGSFQPRQYILDNLTLEKCAGQYIEHVEAVQKLIE